MLLLAASAGARPSLQCPSEGESLFRFTATTLLARLGPRSPPRAHLAHAPYRYVHDAAATAGRGALAHLSFSPCPTPTTTTARDHRARRDACVVAGRPAGARTRAQWRWRMRVVRTVRPYQQLARRGVAPPAFWLVSCSIGLAGRHAGGRYTTRPQWQRASGQRPAAPAGPSKLAAAAAASTVLQCDTRAMTHQCPA